jgi:hypothetical protein
MARTLELTKHDDEGVVVVHIRSDEERDVSVHADGIDLIGQIATLLGKRVSISEHSGDTDPGANDVTVPDFPPEA